MHKSLLILSTLLGVSFSQAQIEVPQTQKALYTPIEATWCGYCGKNGIPTTASIYNQVSDKAIFMGLQPSSSSNLYAPKASAIVNNIGGVTGYPSIALNSELIGVLHGGVQSQLISGINSTYNSTETDVNAGFEWYRTYDSLIVNTNTTFFNTIEGEFQTGVYITEDSIYEYQSNYDDNIPNGNIYHFHVMRDVLSESSFGVSTGSGNMTAGTEITKRFAIKWNSDWDENNIHINTVVWKKDGSSFEYINANNIGEKLANPTIGIEETKVQKTLSIFPNPSSNAIHISAEFNLQNIKIVNSLGEEVLIMDKQDRKKIKIDISNLTPGLYLVNGKDEKGNRLTQKFLKK